MNRPDLSDDDVLSSALTAALDHLDPVPEAAVRAAAAAREIRQVDRELAMLVADDTLDVPFALRDEADDTTLTFVATRLTVEIEIDRDRHVVGVISPPCATVIEVETSVRQESPLATTESDAFGRFRVDVGIGLCRLRIGTGADGVVTSWFYS